MTRTQPRGIDLVVRPEREEASLWRRFRLEAEPQCRFILFDRYSPLARTIAVRHHRRRRPPRPDLSDYQQLAYEGLLQAIDRFDPLVGSPFGAYARRRIAGSISDGVARMTELDSQFSHRRRVERERVRSLAARQDERPSDAIAALSRLAVELALGLMLEETGMIAGLAHADPSPSAYDRLEYRELQARLAQALASLPEAEGRVLRQHYEQGLSFAHVAELMNLSRGRISQLHRGGLQRLRKKLGTSQ